MQRESRRVIVEEKRSYGRQPVFSLYGHEIEPRVGPVEQLVHLLLFPTRALSFGTNIWDKRSPHQLKQRNETLIHSVFFITIGSRSQHFIISRAGVRYQVIK